MNLFFVCGAPKSGTTWLQRILDAHPQVSCAGEGHFVERFTIPAAQVVNAYNRDMGLESAQVYEGRPVYPPVGQAEFDEVARTFILGRLRSRNPASQVAWFGDKTPRYTHQLDALHRLFPQAKIVSIVRDPREVVASNLSHNHRIGVAGVLTAGSANNRAQIRHAVAGWTEAVAGVDAFAARRPDLVCEVGYGALHAQPRETLARLFDFLGAPHDAVLLDEILRATSFEALSGRRPGEEDAQSFFRKGVTGGWEDRLDAGALELILEACGPQMRRKGFLPPDAARAVA